MFLIEEKVKVLQPMTLINQRGEAQKLGDCYVDGRRVYYEHRYICRHCGVERQIDHSMKEIPT